MPSPRSDIEQTVHRANVRDVQIRYIRQFLAGDLTREQLEANLKDLANRAALGPRARGRTDHG